MNIKKTIEIARQLTASTKLEQYALNRILTIFPDDESSRMPDIDFRTPNDYDDWLDDQMMTDDDSDSDYNAKRNVIDAFVRMYQEMVNAEFYMHDNKKLIHNPTLYM